MKYRQLFAIAILLVAAGFLARFSFTHMNEGLSPPATPAETAPPPAPLPAPAIQAEAEIVKAPPVAQVEPAEPETPEDFYYIGMLRELVRPLDNNYAQVYQDGKDAGSGAVLKDFIADMAHFTYPRASTIVMHMDMGEAALADREFQQKRMHYWAGYVLMLQPRLPSFGMLFLGCDPQSCSLQVDLPQTPETDKDSQVAQPKDMGKRVPEHWDMAPDGGG